MPRNRVIALIVIGFVVVVGGALLVIGLLLGDDTDLERQQDDVDPAQSSQIQEREPDAGATEAPEAALQPFYSQRVDWQPCESDEGSECGTLEVPLDYAEPGGETIDLALLRVPAEDQAAKVGSLVVNPGGPGAPGTEYAAAADLVFREPLTAAYDVVGFDPRGTGASAPVDCLPDAELDAYFEADPTPDDAAERREAEAQTVALGQGCLAESGAVAEHVSTEEAARDIDVLRAVLGESELAYFGASYGTRLGSTYADLFPERVGRMVLDGGLDPSLDSRALALGQAGGFQTALEAYVGSCVEDGDCVLGDSVEEGLASITDLLERIDAEPLPAGDRDLTSGLAFYGLVQPLYAEQLWPLLDQALTAAIDQGDGTALRAFADTYASRLPDGTYTNNSAEAIFAINCLDDPYALSPAAAQADAADFEAASPTFGDVFAYSQTACLGFPGATDELTPFAEGPLADGAAPVVVVGTTRDPATPYEWSVALADQLASGVLVSRDGDGHTGYNQGNECVDSAVEAYLVDGDVPGDGLEC
ncbi:alpha/beta hydrolase [Nocardioides lentus]|uniref:Alpha/beta hydrolase n=1 Tax=Nocardioides lentus TaxID=338077 RepID=A0ABN2P9Q1_9ACTN